MRVIVKNDNDVILFDGVVAQPGDFIKLNTSHSESAILVCKVTAVIELASKE